MNRIHCLFTTSIIVFLLIFSTGCDVHISKVPALRAKDRVEIKQLLLALEAYRDRNGVLPSTLEELWKKDPALQDINIKDFSYSSNGLAVADGTRWLIAIPDPKDKAEVIVGRLPVEVTVQKAK
jgi:hypothetical protein